MFTAIINTNLANALALVFTKTTLTGEANLGPLNLSLDELPAFAQAYRARLVKSAEVTLTVHLTQQDMKDAIHTGGVGEQVPYMEIVGWAPEDCSVLWKDHNGDLFDSTVLFDIDETGALKAKLDPQHNGRWKLFS